MSGQRFGALDLTANTDVVLMESGLNIDSTVNVRFVNRSGTSIVVRLALVDSPASTALVNLSNEDYLEFDTVVLANEVLENSGIVVPQAHSLVVRADSNDVTAIAYGFEQERT